MIFKDIFEYYKDGDLNEQGFCELMMLIYETKWGTEPNINNIQNRMCKTIWKGLRHSIKKSVRNAKYQNNKSILQDGNFESDFNNENKPILDTQNNQCDNLHQPIPDLPLNEPKITLNEVVETNDINNNSIDNNMGNYLGTLEEIEEKCKNNFKADLSQQNYKDNNLYHPKGESVLNKPKAALNQKVEVKLSTNKDEFNKILKDYEFRLQEIIENINSIYQFKRRNGYEDLEDLIKSTLRGKYESELKEYINTYIKKNNIIYNF